MLRIGRRLAVFHTCSALSGWGCILLWLLGAVLQRLGVGIAVASAPTAAPAAFIGRAPLLWVEAVLGRGLAMPRLNIGHIVALGMGLKILNRGGDSVFHLVVCVGDGAFDLDLFRRLNFRLFGRAVFFGRQDNRAVRIKRFGQLRQNVVGMRAATRVEHELGRHIGKIGIDQMLDRTGDILEVDVGLRTTLDGKGVRLCILAEYEIRHAQASIASAIEERGIHTAEATFDQCVDRACRIAALVSGDDVDQLAAETK